MCQPALMSRSQIAEPSLSCYWTADPSLLVTPCVFKPGTMNVVLEICREIPPQIQRKITQWVIKSAIKIPCAYFNWIGSYKKKHLPYHCTMHLLSFKMRLSKCRITNSLDFNLFCLIFLSQSSPPYALHGVLGWAILL